MFSLKHHKRDTQQVLVSHFLALTMRVIANRADFEEFDRFESDQSDGLSRYESPENFLDGTSSDESRSEHDADTDSTGNNCQESARNTPLYLGCNLTSKNFD